MEGAAETGACDLEIAAGHPFEREGLAFAPAQVDPRGQEQVEVARRLREPIAASAQKPFELEASFRVHRRGQPVDRIGDDVIGESADDVRGDALPCSVVQPDEKPPIGEPAREGELVDRRV